MGFAENMRILSNINCLLGSGVTYLEQRQQGVDATSAGINLFGNIGNGVIRNQVAYEMQSVGNPIGNTINMCAGYGNPVSNTFGTMALMSACTPWMFFNSPYCGMYSMGMSPYGGCFGGGFYGGLGYSVSPGFWC